MNTGELLDHRRVSSSIDQPYPSHRFRLFTARGGGDVSDVQRRPVASDEFSIRDTFECSQQIDRRAREPSLAVREGMTGGHCASELVLHRIGHGLGVTPADEPTASKVPNDFANDFAAPKGFRVEATHQK